MNRGLVSRSLRDADTVAAHRSARGRNLRQRMADNSLDKHTWANAWGYLLEPGEDIHADRARAVLLTPGGSYRCTLEFAPDTPDGWFVPPMYRTANARRAA